ncbi:MAG: hypothetical protein ACRDLQ_03585 [Solirubrobacterales bacterium]
MPATWTSSHRCDLAILIGRDVDEALEFVTALDRGAGSGVDVDRVGPGAAASST